MIDLFYKIFEYFIKFLLKLSGNWRIMLKVIMEIEKIFQEQIIMIQMFYYLNIVRLQIFILYKNIYVYIKYFSRIDFDEGCQRMIKYQYLLCFEVRLEDLSRVILCYLEKYL